MRIAQISDFHLRTDGKLLPGGIDSVTALRHCADYVNRLTPRPDAVLVTGDLVNASNPEGYRILKDIMRSLSAPAYLIPGNVDDRTEMLDAFKGSGLLPSTGPFLHYVVDDHPVRLIGLDTKSDDDEGLLCSERLAWLANQLSATPSTPTLIFMHHPPVHPADGDGQAPAYEGAADFLGLVEQNPQIKLIISGHLHRRGEISLAGTRLSVAGSVTASQKNRLPPDACPVYVWDTAGRFRTVKAGGVMEGLRRMGRTLKRLIAQ